MQVLIWGLRTLLSMLRCMLGSVKGVKESPMGEGKLGNGKRGCLKILKGGKTLKLNN